MIVQLALSAVLGVSAAHADNFGDCVRKNNGYEQVCVGQRVIDTNGYIGSVRSVFRNGQIIVRRDGYSNDTTYSVESLAAETPCDLEGDICKGDVVIDTNGYTGKVMMVFTNDQLKVRRDGYSNDTQYSKSNLSQAVLSYGQFAVGTQVIDTNNYTGVVQKIFANGQTKVRRDGYSNDTQYSISNLAYAVSRTGQISVGDRVIDTNNYQGVVNAAYSNGKVRVRRDGYSNDTFYSASQLSPQGGGRRIPTPQPRNPYPGNGPGRGPGRNHPGQVNATIRSGDRVMDTNNYTGVVQSVFANGKVIVRRDGYSNDTTYTIDQLGKSVSFYQGVAPGQRVIDRNNYTGKVVEVFTNGKATVQRDGYSNLTTYSLSEISN